MDGRWDLSVFYRGFDDPQIEADFARISDLCVQIRETLDSKGEPVTLLEKTADQEEELNRLFGKLTGFAGLTQAAEAGHKEAMQLYDRCMQESVELDMLSSAFSRYLGAMDAKTFEDTIAASPKLQSIAFHLRREREAAEHTPAPEIEEWLLNMSLSGAGTFSASRPAGRDADGRLPRKTASAF